MGPGLRRDRGGAARLDAAGPAAKDGGMERIYDAPHLARNPANSAALTPLGFLQRAAAVYPDKLAVVHGDPRLTFRQFDERRRRLADALRRPAPRARGPVPVQPPHLPGLLA